jgi:hypothetical protein
MTYDFTHDFCTPTTHGIAEGEVEVFYEVIDGELFINRFSKFKGKLYTAEGDVICDFVTEKHHDLGKQIYDNQYFSIVYACNANYEG